MSRLLLQIVFLSLVLGCMGGQEPTLNDSASTSTVGDDCTVMHDSIEEEMDEANYCSSDGDCKVLMLGAEYIAFGCHHFINKDEDEQRFYSLMDDYNQECTRVINDCAPAPDSRCVGGKCVYVDLLQGVAGKIGLFEGNCMPSPDKPGCSPEDVEAKIVVSRPTKTFNDSLVLESAMTDDKGYFQVNLPEGEYSLFIEHEGEMFCDNLNDVGGGNIVCTPFTVEGGRVAIIDADINDALW